jgi:NAD(P)-dependent dehydrogenase (short-subunit alcohol dehydrogenase family)
MSTRLAEKVCIITGTGGSIGRASALAFAREGALIVGCGLRVDDADAITTEELVRAAGGRMVSLLPCDLIKSADCRALVDLAVRKFGRVDVLFNNAAMARFNWLEDISDEEWDRNRREEVDLVF